MIQSPSCVGSWPKKLGNSWRDPGISVSPGDSGFFLLSEKSRRRALSSLGQGGNSSEGRWY